MTREDEQLVLQLVVDVLIKVAVIAVLAYVSFRIAEPFLPVILWGGIIAVILSPLVERLQKRFKNRKRIIFGIVVLGVALMLGPTLILSEKVVRSSQSLYALKQGSALELPPPPDKVRTWPLVGESLYAFWLSASNNLEATLQAHEEEVRAVAQWLVAMIASGLSTVLIFCLAFFVASAFLLYEAQMVRFSKGLFRRLAGDLGNRWADVTAATIRSVVLGLVGIAAFQALLSFLGMLVMDIPLAAAWGLLVLFVAIVQLPPLLIGAPVIVYAYSIHEPAVATIFAVYMVLVSMSDALLKPLFLGRGVAEIPTLVILVGAIGGMILMGMIGLFLGAVILSISYLLFSLWMREAEPAV